MSPCLERLSIRPLFEDEEHLQLILSSVERVEYLISSQGEIIWMRGVVAEIPEDKVWTIGNVRHDCAATATL